MPRKQTKEEFVREYVLLRAGVVTGNLDAAAAAKEAERLWDLTNGSEVKESTDSKPQLLNENGPFAPGRK